jgi:hypothetical protein
MDKDLLIVKLCGLGLMILCIILGVIIVYSVKNDNNNCVECCNDNK